MEIQPFVQYSLRTSCVPGAAVPGPDHWVAKEIIATRNMELAVSWALLRAKIKCTNSFNLYKLHGAVTMTIVLFYRRGP